MCDLCEWKPPEHHTDFFERQLDRYEHKQLHLAEAAWAAIGYLGTLEGDDARDIKIALEAALSNKG